MNNLISLINSFDTQTLDKFGDYINSPFFNNRGDIQRFYKYFINKIPLTEINRREVYETVYKGNEYNEQVIVNLFSRTKNHHTENCKSRTHLHLQRFRRIWTCSKYRSLYQKFSCCER